MARKLWKQLEIAEKPIFVHYFVLEWDIDPNILLIMFRISPHQIRNYQKSPKITRNHWKLPKISGYHQITYIGALVCTELRYWPKILYIMFGNLPQKVRNYWKVPSIIESYVLKGTTKIISNWKSPENARYPPKWLIRVIESRVIIRYEEAYKRCLCHMHCIQCRDVGVKFQWFIIDDGKNSKLKLTY